MSRSVIFLTLFFTFFPFTIVEPQRPLTPAQTIHLVEHKLADLRAGTFRARSVTFEGDQCVVSGVQSVHAVQAFIDARTARVLRMKRDNVDFYAWEGIKVVGHRGNIKFTPENTLPAIAKAIELGCDLIEIDIRETSDGELILMHDETVDRTTDGAGKVAELRLADIAKMDAGSWYAPEFAGVRVPTLREALAAMRGRALPDLDFKAGTPGKLIDILREENLLGRVTLYCGDWDLLRATLELAPDGFMLRPTVPGGETGLPIVLHAFDPQIVNINWEEFSEDLVRAVHLAGKKSFLNAMQQDTEYIMQLMMNTMPDYLQSDHVDLLLPMTRERGWHR
ncbi:hypothetical protein EH223_11405 [candidate division KSB1 bacterium]|nr:glycerophosphodiester phosphodiesterase family protein [candidate division KSB1 bacterium]RQW02911.1 MAG: hypothetical protein EH223_11405 [candidate division KSB1 bacterium]